MIRWVECRIGEEGRRGSLYAVGVAVGRVLVEGIPGLPRDLFPEAF